MAINHSLESYNAHVARLKQDLNRDGALRAAIGGEFVAVGMLEYFLLLSLGLTDGQSVIDVGCGSGRLACQLAAMEKLDYLGVDVVADLLDYAKRLTQRPDWNFRVTSGIGIPCGDGQADFVCFFSVFTHLVHEETFEYLKEARRVLKPGGKIVFSFLEFRVPCHWDIFQDSLERRKSGAPLNQFMDRDGIKAWAEKLGLTVELIADGDRPHIPISQDIVWESGNVMKDLGNLGQSVAVLSVPQGSAQKKAERSSHASPAPRSMIPLLEGAPATPAAPGAKVSGVPVTSSSGRFMNLAARGYVGKGDAAMILGFIIRGGDQLVLARAVGPGLARLNVVDPLQAPTIEVIGADQKVIASNAGWTSGSDESRHEIEAATRLIGAFALDDADSALLLKLKPGNYSMIVRSRNNSVGNVLTEIYEIPLSAAGGNRPAVS